MNIPIWLRRQKTLIEDLVLSYNDFTTCYSVLSVESLAYDLDDNKLLNRLIGNHTIVKTIVSELRRRNRLTDEEIKNLINPTFSSLSHLLNFLDLREHRARYEFSGDDRYPQRGHDV